MGLFPLFDPIVVKWQRLTEPVGIAGALPVARVNWADEQEGALFLLVCVEWLVGRLFFYSDDIRAFHLGKSVPLVNKDS